MVSIHEGRSVRTLVWQSRLHRQLGTRRHRDEVVGATSRGRREFAWKYSFKKLSLLLSARGYLDQSDIRPFFAAPVAWRVHLRCRRVQSISTPRLPSQRTWRSE